MDIKIQRKKFLETLFNPGEHACFGFDGYEVDVTPAHRFRPTKDVFVTLNPLDPYRDAEKKVTNTGRRADANVTAFRNILVELDVGSLEEQYAAIERVGLPFSTCTYSGGKSLHFIICLTSSLGSKEKYEEMVTLIYDALEGRGISLDRTCKNPSRFTRLAGSLRDKEVVQELIECRHRLSRQVLEDFIEDNIESIIEVEEARLLKIPEQPPLPPEADEEGFRGELALSTKNFIRLGKKPGEGGRNRALYAAACDFCNQGYTLEEAMDRLFLISTSSKVGLAPGEVRKTIASAYKNAVYNPRIRA